MSASLIQLVNGTPVNTFKLEKDQTTIGRAPDNDIHIEDPAASLHHAAIETHYPGESSDVKNLLFHIKDLKSTNTTLVNGEPIERVELKNNDLVQIGWTYFKFVYQPGNFEKTQKIKKGWLPGIFHS